MVFPETFAVVTLLVICTDVTQKGLWIRVHVEAAKQT